jgi:hypothetical protein
VCIVWCHLFLHLNSGVHIFFQRLFSPLSQLQILVSTPCILIDLQEISFINLIIFIIFWKQNELYLQLWTLYQWDKWWILLHHEHYWQRLFLSVWLLLYWSCSIGNNKILSFKRFSCFKKTFQFRTCFWKEISLCWVLVNRNEQTSFVNVKVSSFISKLKIPAAIVIALLIAFELTSDRTYSLS